MNYVLYNPLSGNGTGGERARLFRESLPPRECCFRDIRELREDYRSLFSSLEAEDRLILAGGDGTLHRFVNASVGMELPCELYLFPTGNENRFRSRISERGQRPVPIRSRISALPRLTVGNRTIFVLNGVGVGLDGYVRERERKQSRISEESLHLPSVQTQGLLFGCKSFSAEVQTDTTDCRLSLVRSLSLTVDRRTEGGLRLPSNMLPKRGDNPSKIAAVSICGMEGYRLPLLLPSLWREGFPGRSDAVWSSVGGRFRIRLSSPQALAVDGELLYGVSAFSMEQS